MIDAPEIVEAAAAATAQHQKQFLDALRNMRQAKRDAAKLNRRKANLVLKTTKNIAREHARRVNARARQILARG
jgi:hypothetical protein